MSSGEVVWLLLDETSELPDIGKLLEALGATTGATGMLADGVGFAEETEGGNGHDEGTSTGDELLGIADAAEVVGLLCAVTAGPAGIEAWEGALVLGEYAKWMSTGRGNGNEKDALRRQATSSRDDVVRRRGVGEDWVPLVGVRH
jgi:hypothetical protein